MSDNEGRLPVLSVHLSRVLDDLGLNTLTVRRRRENLLFMEQFQTLLYKTIKKQCTVYYFGSQVEGTTILGLKSDLDGLTCNDNYYIIRDMSDLQQGKCNLLMLHEYTAPGYCRLQMIGPDEPQWATANLLNDTNVYDRRKRVILKNTCLPYRDIDEHQQVRNGPAQACSLQGRVTVDVVNAFRCNGWPREAVSWAHKYRHGNWPEQSLIEKAVRTGFFLVPVGYKLSENEILEWRISLSLTERCLMFSMNMTQLKCYVVLKMVMKCLVIPYVGESISSYHCKTALFYCSEDTGIEFWVEDNIFQCITRCLTLLLRWIQDEYCPHFIMPESNLFAGKINQGNKHKLLSILEDMLASSGQFLFRISTDELGDKLRVQCSAPQTRILFTDSIYTMAYILHTEISRVFEIEGTKDDRILKYCAKANRTEAIALARAQLAALLERTKFTNHAEYYEKQALIEHIYHAENYERQAILALTETLSCLLGSMLASDSLSCQKEVSQEAFCWLLRGAENSNAYMLNLASVLFCDGLFEKAELVLQVVESRYKRKYLHPVCHHTTQYIIINKDLELIPQRLTHQNEVARRRLFAQCVAFSVHELHSAPPALRYELFRSVGEDSLHRAPLIDRWMALAVADFLPFLYYLQYLTYGLRKPDLQRRSLYNLERCIMNNEKLGHLETALNLLGQCMEADNNPAAALDCYRRSLGVRPRDNAANWHLAILVYREITATRERK